MIHLLDDSNNDKKPEDKNTITNQPPSSTDQLVDPITLAYRLRYLIMQRDSEHLDPFKITKRGLEALAENKNIVEQQVKDPAHKFFISEAYIAHMTYELERINCYLIKADREYLVGLQANLKKLKKLAPSDDEISKLFNLSQDDLQQAFQEAIKEKTEGKSSHIQNQKKTIEKSDEKSVLLCIWQKLLQHTKEHLQSHTTNSSSINTDITISYRALSDNLSYKMHQNGLASYLYSIEQYCTQNQLPKLNYLVVKGSSKLPEGIVATDHESIKIFKDHLEQIVELVKKSDGGFQDIPINLTFKRKSRVKKVTKKQESFTPLTNE